MINYVNIKKNKKQYRNNKIKFKKYDFKIINIYPRRNHYFIKNIEPENLYINMPK